MQSSHQLKNIYFILYLYFIYTYVSVQHCSSATKTLGCYQDSFSPKAKTPNTMKEIITDTMKEINSDLGETRTMHRDHPLIPHSNL